MLIPTGGHTIFNCRVNSGYTIAGWRVYVPDVMLEYFTESRQYAESLALLGIIVRDDDLH